jgi:DNA modification methylase
MPEMQLPTSVDSPLLLHGDCLDLLATLPDASVDVVITDPPAGIGFMFSASRVWDDFTHYEPRTRAGRNALRMLTSAMNSDAALQSLAAAVKQARADAKAAEGDRKRTADAVAKALARALADAREAHRVALGDLGDFAGTPRWAAGFVSFLVDVWTEVDRVLKPGGIVCAWALPKTADLAGLAMRIVGWGLADSLLHLFSGMPKNGDVGKKIDAMLGAAREVVGSRPQRTNGPAVRRRR